MKLASAGTVRQLDARDAAAIWPLVDADPVGNVVVAARLHATGCDPRRLGAQLWGYRGPDGLESLCFAGANLIPVAPTRPALAAFARQALQRHRQCSSIFGRQEAVEPLWHLLQAAWSPAREVRAGQRLLVMSSAPAAAPDRAVRRVRLAEVDAVLPACVAMYTEEVGVSPIGRDRGASYRARVTDLVRAGNAFARIENGEVVFKAEIGAATAAACQVQGVWVTPALRGRGMGTAGVAAVVQEALRTVAPVVSLYVNAHNVAGRRAYANVGFAPAGTFMSVLF